MRLLRLILSTALFCFAFFPLHAQESDSSTRIIGGEEAKSGQWPSMAALIQAGVNAFDGHFCGGNYIGDGYVLTAAHCVADKDADEIEVVLGVSDLTDSPLVGERIAIKELYVHELYNLNSTDYDIALIELEQLPSVETALLATWLDYGQVNTGETLTVMGWGNLQSDPNLVADYPELLYQVDVPLVSQTQCRSLGGDYAGIGDDAFCAGYLAGGKDSCQGDSGGPIVFNDNGEYKQLGIVSWGVGCAQENAYGVYANVGYFEEWIAQKIAGQHFINQDDLGVLEIRSQHYSHTFTIENNNSQSVVYQLSELENATLDEDNCSDLVINNGGSCTVSIIFSVLDYGEAQSAIVLSHDVEGIEPFTLEIHYIGMDAAEIELDSGSSGGAMGWWLLVLFAMVGKRLSRRCTRVIFKGITRYND